MTQTGPLIVIDDDQDDLQLIKDAITSLGISHSVKLFENTADAMDYLVNDGQPMLILCDINMPRENGIEFKQRIDADPVLRKRSIPFAFLSTVAQPAVVEAAYLVFTVQGFFQKPDNYKDYQSLMKRIIDYWQVCRHPND